MLASLFARRAEVDVQRSALTFNQYLEQVGPYLPYFTHRKSGDPETAPKTATAVAARAFTGNSVVFACAAVRRAVFSEIDLRWQDLKTKKLYGNQALILFEQPWTGGCFADVLRRMEQDDTCAGNSFWYNAGSLVRSDTVNLQALAPDKMTIMSAKVDGRFGGSLGWEKAGYWYQEDEDSIPEWLELSEVAHYAPTPDPRAFWRGMSWLTPVLREVDVDNSFNDFKQSHMENAATPNLVVTFDPSVTPDQFKLLTEVIKRKMTGSANAGKTLALGGGADVKVIGSNFEQLSLKAVQGAGETRIAAAAGVPAVIVGLSESLQGSSLNEGNYGMARRRFADVSMRPSWKSAVGALSTLVPTPDGSRLWYTDRDVAFLQEDVKDEADIREAQARTIRTLVDAGYTPESAVSAVIDGDFTTLVHSGLYSVQLQAAGTPKASPARADQMILELDAPAS